MPNQFGKLTDEEVMGGTAPAAGVTPRPSGLSDEEVFGQHVEIAPVAQHMPKNQNMDGLEILGGAITVLFVLILFSSQVKGMFLKTLKTCTDVGAGNKLDRQQRIILTILAGVTMASFSAYSALHPADGSYQHRLDIQFHPWASVVGGIIPTIVLSPIFYWYTGRIGRERKKSLKALKICANATRRLVFRCKKIILACFHFFGFMIPDFPPMPPKPPEGGRPTMRDERRSRLLLFLEKKNIREVLNYIECGSSGWDDLFKTGAHSIDEIKNALTERYEFLKKSEDGIKKAPVERREQDENLYFRRRTILLLGVIAIGIWRGPVIKLISYDSDKETQAAGGRGGSGREYRPYRGGSGR